MAGNANSGRRPRPTDIEIRLRVIQKSWEILEEQLNDPDISDDIKRDIAMKVAPKTIPTELAGGFTAKVVAMGTITKNLGGNLEFNIGTPYTSEDPGHTEQATCDN